MTYEATNKDLTMMFNKYGYDFRDYILEGGFHFAFKLKEEDDSFDYEYCGDCGTYHSYSWVISKKQEAFYEELIKYIKANGIIKLEGKTFEESDYDDFFEDMYGDTWYEIEAYYDYDFPPLDDICQKLHEEEKRVSELINKSSDPEEQKKYSIFLCGLRSAGSIIWGGKIDDWQLNRIKEK